MIRTHFKTPLSTRQKLTATYDFFASHHNYGYAPTPHKAGFAGTPILSQEKPYLARQFYPGLKGGF